MSLFVKYLTLLFVFSARAIAFFDKSNRYIVQHYETTKVNIEANIQKDLLRHVFNMLKPTTTNEPPKSDKREGSICRLTFNNQTGLCIQADLCLSAIKDSLPGVKMDICSNQNNAVIICCPVTVSHPGLKNRISARMCKKFQQNAQSTEMNLTGQRCVQDKTEYPHMAAIGWSQENGKAKWACAGSLISEQFVLTTGHCTELNGIIPDIVRLGAHYLNNADNILDVGIKRIFRHPRYHSWSNYHNIALLKLSEKIQFSSQIQPACLWQLTDVNVRKVVALGWSRTGYMDPMSYELRKVKLNIIDQDFCRDTYRDDSRLPKGIVHGQFCARNMESGMDTCQGDFGVQVLAELAKFDCVRFIVGLPSIENFCGTEDAPVVYTKVQKYLTWIENIVF